jgi:hypothetical protein
MVCCTSPVVVWAGAPVNKPAVITASVLAHAAGFAMRSNLVPAVTASVPRGGVARHQPDMLVEQMNGGGLPFTVANDRSCPHHFNMAGQFTTSVMGAGFESCVDRFTRNRPSEPMS